MRTVLVRVQPPQPNEVRCSEDSRLESRHSLLARGAQGSPRHVGHNMPGSIHQANIGGLHERVDENNFEEPFLLTAFDVLAFLGRRELRCVGHLVLQWQAVYRTYSSKTLWMIRSREA